MYVYNLGCFLFCTRTRSALTFGVEKVNFAIVMMQATTKSENIVIIVFILSLIGKTRNTVLKVLLFDS